MGARSWHIAGNVGALVIRIRVWDPYTTTIIGNPQKIVWAIIQAPIVRVSGLGFEGSCGCHVLVGAAGCSMNKNETSVNQQGNLKQTS